MLKPQLQQSQQCCLAPAMLMLLTVLIPCPSPSPQPSARLLSPSSDLSLQPLCLRPKASLAAELAAEMLKPQLQQSQQCCLAPAMLMLLTVLIPCPSPSPQPSARLLSPSSDLSLQPLCLRPKASLAEISAELAAESSRRCSAELAAWHPHSHAAPQKPAHLRERKAFSAQVLKVASKPPTRPPHREK